MFILWLSLCYPFFIYLGVDRELWKICCDFQWERGPDSMTYCGHRFTRLCWLCDMHSMATSVFQPSFHLLVASCHEGTLDSF